MIKKWFNKKIVRVKNKKNTNFGFNYKINEGKT